MKFKLDFVELETLKDLLDETHEAMDDFEEHFSNIIDTISEETEGEALEKLNSLSEEVIPQLKELSEAFSEQKDIAEKYIDGHRDLNMEHSGIYMLDTNEVKGQLNNVIDELDEIDNISKITNKMDNFIEKYEKKMSEFEQVNSSINIEEDYEDKEDKQQYIKNKQREIEEYIDNFKFNRDTALDEITDILHKLENSIEDDIEIIEDFKDILQDIEDFEEEFNPGFWDKHGNQIVAIARITAMFAGSPLSWVLNAALFAYDVGTGIMDAGGIENFLKQGIVDMAIGYAFDKTIGKALGPIGDKLEDGIGDTNLFENVGDRCEFCGLK